MTQVDVRDMAGKVLRQLDLDERVFGIEPNMAVMHQAVVAQLANQRKGTHSTKTRGEVAGGGKKPWRQKGTGRARQGSTRAPHWRGGGIVFGPKPRDYHQDFPRKMRRLAMRSVLSAKLRDGEVVVIDNFTLPAPKTREMKAALTTIGATGSTLVVLGGANDEIKRAAANLPKVRAVAPGSTNLLDVLNHQWLVLTVEAIDTLTTTLLSDRHKASGKPEQAAAEGAPPRRRASSASASSAATNTPAAESPAARASSSGAGAAAPPPPTENVLPGAKLGETPPELPAGGQGTAASEETPNAS
jgi:large subunit ribosomal protein L4